MRSTGFREDIRDMNSSVTRIDDKVTEHSDQIRQINERLASVERIAMLVRSCGQVIQDLIKYNNGCINRVGALRHRGFFLFVWLSKLARHNI